MTPKTRNAIIRAMLESWEPEYSGLCGDPFAEDKKLLEKIESTNEAAENA